MNQLFVRSLLVVTLLFGLLFAVGAGVLYYYHFPVVWAVIFAVAVVLLQYLASPFFIDRIFRIKWIQPEELTPEFGEFFRKYCEECNLKQPKFGIIEDGNPNAFTYGRGKWDARLVVTRGLLQMLEPEEYEAVVAHEIGHIKHNDFIIMTIASLVPMLLYLIYAWTNNNRRINGAVFIALGAYVAYIISQYIVMLLSRIREYFADENAAQAMPNANAISTALVKIAYGLAQIPQEQIKTDKKGKQHKEKVASKAGMMGSLGICNFSSASAMVISSSTIDGRLSMDYMLRAMQWGFWNPWAKLFELQSTHPLVAHRVRAASIKAIERNQEPAFPVSMQPTRSYWGAFFMDLFFLSLPWAGLILGLLIGYKAHDMSSKIINFDLFSYAFLLGGIGWMMRLGFSYGKDWKMAKVADMVGEVEVSHIRSIPVEISGHIIGRGVPGVFWSKDLIMQDGTGFLTIIYRQPLSIIEDLFGIFRAGKLIDKKGTFRGWYRRGPIPYFELKEAEFEDGGRIKCHYSTFIWCIAALCTSIGIFTTLA